MINAIICDLGKVLLNFDHMHSCRELSKICALTPEDIYKKMFKSGIERAYELGQISSETFSRKVLDTLGINVDMSLIHKFWVEIFSPVDGMNEIISSLKKDYTLILLSNTNEWHFTYCEERFPAVRLFDSYVLSFQVGVRKPDPAIFKKALDCAKVKPNQCLYVDDIQDYADAASNLGIVGVRFTGIDQFKSDLDLLGVRYE